MEWLPGCAFPAFKEARPLANGEQTTWNSITIRALPMYNLPATEDSRHPKGRGNGYLLTVAGKCIYFSGDTEDIPEMRQLEGIDAAFVCMNLPYTMSIEQAADAVLEFQPKVVYPFHYRGKDGLSDVEAFKAMVEKENGEIEVRLLNWYPER
ncbi:MAG: MBL fold metallo-hydrolase [Phaeodactylibacter sp.]|nr:MBL fold metallo-hydrolase [Phaeodactylibacter sp.]